MWRLSRFLLLQVCLLMLGVWPGISQTALAKPQPRSPQNVILITLDGVRYKDIFKPETLSFLAKKGGFPLAKTQLYALTHGGLAFGTQKDGDEMEVGNHSAKSLPGYRALLSGMFESQCKDNSCQERPQTTLLDGLYQTLRSSCDVAVFSSWNKIQYATEAGGRNITQSIGLNPALHLSGDYAKRHRAIDAASRKNPPGWENARFDQYTWAMATDYIKTFHPRFTFISLLDTDEYAHSGKRTAYFYSLHQFDNWLDRFLDELKHQHADYLKNTSIVITTDHGRGGDSLTFDHHGYTDLGLWMPGSENIWALVLPSKSLREHYRIQASPHGKKTKYSQLDLRPTLAQLLEFPHLRGAGPGQSLITLQARKSAKN